MASLHLPPSPRAGNGSSSASGASSNPQYTPVSNGSDEEGSAPLFPETYPHRGLRLQTRFSDDAEIRDQFAHYEDEIGFEYHTGEDMEQKMYRVSSAREYTAQEEKEVVRSFDRRLVPFLALLYLLSFLDRSSMLICRLCLELCILYSPHKTTVLIVIQILGMQRSLDLQRISISHLRNMNGFLLHSISRTFFSNG